MGCVACTHPMWVEELCCSLVQPASCGVLLQVTALETRVLQLQADEEVASVTAGPEAQAAAEAKLQQAQEALLAVEQV